MRNILSLRPLSANQQAWLVFVVFGIFAIWANHSFLFSPDSVPWFDFTANDLLIDKAKKLQLFHGNYSRVGFYHPGPFYLYLQAAGEWIFHDLIPLFPSRIAAQFAAGALFAAGAMACCWWLGASMARHALGGLIVVLFVLGFCLKFSAYSFDFYDFRTHGNFLFSIWPPHFYMLSCLYLSVAVLALFLYGAQWWPWIIFAIMQLMHGHASFIGIGSLMIACVALAEFYYFTPAAAFRIKLRQYFHSHQRYFLLCLAIIAVMLIPPIIQLWQSWPGEFLLYLKVAQQSKINALPDLASAFANFAPLLALIPLLFLLDSSREKKALVIWLTISNVVMLMYAIKGVDNLRHVYLLFWYIAIQSFCFGIWLVVWVQYSRKIMLLIAAMGVAFLSFISHYYKPVHQEYRGTAEYDYIIDQFGKFSPEKPVVLYLDFAEFGSALEETMQLIRRAETTGKRTFCIHPKSWGLMMLNTYRCLDNLEPSATILVTHQMLPHPIFTKTIHGYFYDMGMHREALTHAMEDVEGRDNFVTPLMHHK